MIRLVVGLGMLIDTAFCILVVLLLRRFFWKKIHPNVRYFMWALVAVKILVPIHIVFVLENTEFTEAMQKLPPMAWLAEKETLAGTNVQVAQGVFLPEKATEFDSEQGDNIFLPLEPGKAYVAENLPAKTMEMAQRLPLEQTQANGKNLIWTGIWLLGVLVAGGYIVSRNGKLYKKIKASRKFVEKLDNGLCVYEMEGMNCLMGLVHPAIYLSPEVLRDERVKKHVLMHELQHYRVRDNIWVLVRNLCLIFQWYNPLVWVAYVESGKDCELACDYRVTKEMSRQERTAYGESLLQVVTMGGSNNRVYLATSMGEDKRFYKKRLEAVMMKNKGKMWVLPCIMLLLVAVVAFSTVSYSCKEKEEQVEAQKQEKVEAAQQQKQEEFAEKQQITDEAEAEKQQEVVDATKQQVIDEEVIIQYFQPQEVVVIPEVPVYTYEEANALSTATVYRDMLPGAAEGTWYIMEIDGIEYFYGRFDFKAEEEPALCGAGYVIVGDNYSLANGLKVGMTEEEVLELFPNMAVVDFEGKDVYKKVIGSQIWNLGHYPQSESWLEGGIDYQWTDQFDYVMMGLIDQGDNTLPLYVGLMVKDNIVKAISFHSPTAG